MNTTNTNTIKQIVALGQAGLTASAIATKTGVTVPTALNYLRAAGIPVRGRGRPAKPQTPSYHAIYSKGYRAGVAKGALQASKASAS